MNFGEYKSNYKKKIINEHITKAYADAVVVPLDEIGTGPDSHKNRRLFVNPSNVNAFLKFINASKRIMRGLTGNENDRVVWPIAQDSTTSISQNAENERILTRKNIKNKIPKSLEELYNVSVIKQSIIRVIAEFITQKISTKFENLDLNANLESTSLEYINIDEFTKVGIKEFKIIISNLNSNFTNRNITDITTYLSSDDSRLKNILESQFDVTISSIKFVKDELILKCKLSGLKFISYSTYDVDNTPEDVLVKNIVHSNTVPIKPHEAITRELTVLASYVNNIINYSLSNTLNEFAPILNSECQKLKHLLLEKRKKVQTQDTPNFLAAVAEFKTIYNSEEPMRINSRINEIQGLLATNPENRQQLERELNSLNIRLTNIQNRAAQDNSQEIAIDNNARYDLVISNLKQDIIGMSTNKGWPSCQNTNAAVSHRIFKSYLTKEFRARRRSNTCKQYLRELLADPAAQSFYVYFNRLNQMLNNDTEEQIQEQIENIVELLIVQKSEMTATSAHSHARPYESAHGAVMILYVIPHVRKYVSGVLKDRAQYEKEIAESLRMAKGRITLLPGRSVNKNKLTFLPGTYSEENIGFNTVAYQPIGTRLTLTSQEASAYKQLMIHFYNSQGLTASDVSRNNTEIYYNNGSWYYNQGTYNTNNFSTDMEQ